MKKISSKILQKKKRLRKPYKPNRLNFFNTTNKGYITFILIVLAVAAVLFAGSFASFTLNSPDNSTYLLVTPSPYGGYKSLELHTLQFTTPTPIPTLAPTSGAQQAQCANSNLNQEPETFQASDPVPPAVATINGQLKVWATDENPPFLAPGAQVNNATGQITNPGNTTAQDGQGNIYAPRIYVDNDNIVSNIHPIYPNIVKGTYSTPNGSANGPGPARDPLPANAQGSQGNDDEYIWNVSSIASALGLQSGSGIHHVQFVFHDGDDDQGLGCFTISL